MKPQSTITTSVTYLADGANAVWPVPFPFSVPAAVAVKLVATDGTEKRLAQGRDCLLSDRNVLAAVPAGCKVVIWLEEPVNAALDAQAISVRRAAAQVQPVVQPAQAAQSEDSALIRLQARLDDIENDRARVLEAARQSQADMQIQALATAGSEARQTVANAGVAAVESAVADINRAADEKIAELRKQTELLQAKLAEAEERAAQADQTTAKAVETMRNLLLSLEREKAGQTVAMQSVADESIGRIGLAERQAKAAVASTVSQLSEQSEVHCDDCGKNAMAARTSVTQAQDARMAAQQAAASARQSAARADASERGGDVHERNAKGWAQAGKQSADASHDCAEQSWRSAVSASLWGRRPGIAAVTRFEDLSHVCSGVYVINPFLIQAHSPTPFMGVWPVSTTDEITWDGVFFLGQTYPEHPAPPPMPPKPEKPVCPCPDLKPDMGSGHWLPCRHTHCG